MVHPGHGLGSRTILGERDTNVMGASRSRGGAEVAEESPAEVAEESPSVGGTEGKCDYGRPRDPLGVPSRVLLPEGILESEGSRDPGRVPWGL